MINNNYDVNIVNIYIIVGARIQNGFVNRTLPHFHVGALSPAAKVRPHTIPILLFVRLRILLAYFLYMLSHILSLFAAKVSLIFIIIIIIIIFIITIMARYPS